MSTIVTTDAISAQPVSTHIPSKRNNSIKLMDEAQAKVNLLGMTQAQLADYFKSIGEKPFRATQVIRWIYQQGVTDFEQMTNLSKGLRDKLSANACVTPPKVIHRQYSDDGTRKWVFEVLCGGYDGDAVDFALSQQFGCQAQCKGGFTGTWCCDREEISRFGGEVLFEGFSLPGTKLAGCTPRCAFGISRRQMFCCRGARNSSGYVHWSSGSWGPSGIDS